MPPFQYRIRSVSFRFFSVFGWRSGVVRVTWNKV